MRPGSVIVDLAAETGGNCELTEPGEVVERDGVTIVGPVNLPSDDAVPRGQMYSRNVQALLCTWRRRAALVLDSDEITAGAACRREEATA